MDTNLFLPPCFMLLFLPGSVSDTCAMRPELWLNKAKNTGLPRRKKSEGNPATKIHLPVFPVQRAANVIYSFVGRDT
jgi:hypothetical protein